MKKVLVFCVLLSLWLSLDGSCVWAIDVGWMQEGVRVWYFGAAGTGMSSDAEEAYLFTSIDGTNAQVTHHSTINHWVSPNPVDTGTYAILGKEGPCWIHPQTLQTLKSGDHWQGQEIVTVLPGPYTYDTFINEFHSIPYLLLPIKTLFDLKSQRNIVKIVYMMEDFSTGTGYFDAETGLLLFRTNSTGFVTVFFILSEINYDFASQQAFAEDNGPHTGFKSNIIKTSSASNYVMIQSSVETRYGNTVQMWVSTSAGGSINIYAPPNENYCFFGSEPVLRRKYMTATPNYPPEDWNEYGEYLWWWVPQEALQSSSINILNVPMTRTSTEPYTFAAIGGGTGLYFSNIIFDNDGYMTDFSAKYSAIGLNIDLGPSASPGVPIHLIDGLEYYRNTMGRATPLPPPPTLISPSGTITTTTPTYSWNAVSEATEYDLKVNDSKGDKILRWYTSSEAGCASGIGTCSVTPTTALATGPGTWWIQTKNSAGTGPWSSGMSFTVEGISTPNLPSGPTNAGTNTSYSYVIGGAASNVGHSIQYFFDWGDGTNSDWLPVGTTSALHSWTSASTYLIKAQARCAAHISAVSSWSGNLSVFVDTVSNPTTPSGVTSGTVGVSYVYSTSGSSSELGHPIQYLFDWGDGSNSGWLPVGKVTASKSWSSVGTYLIKVQARCSIHTSVVSLFSDVLTVSIEPPSITLQSPPNGEIFNSCFLTTSHQPTFTWTPNGTFTKITILFSPSLMDFTAPIVKASIQPTKNNWLPSIWIWQKIMVSSNNNGSIRDIYWKVVGAMKDKTLWESEPGNISIGNTTAPEIQSPGEGDKLPPGIPPTFIFNTNCNIKFELDISSVSDFGDPKKIKKITYTIKDPNLTPTVQKTLSSVQWKAVNKLIGTATGYFRFRAWDGVKRETISEVRSFTVQ